MHAAVYWIQQRMVPCMGAHCNVAVCGVATVAHWLHGCAAALAAGFAGEQSVLTPDFVLTCCLAECCALSCTADDDDLVLECSEPEEEEDEASNEPAGQHDSEEDEEQQSSGAEDELSEEQEEEEGEATDPDEMCFGEHT